MNILVSGSHGLIGSSLIPYLRNLGHNVVRLQREKGLEDQSSILWDPIGKTIDKEPLNDIDAVIHLAGENVGSGKWNSSKRAAIRESRIEGTQFLCQTVASLASPPQTFISASAVGYYGNRGDTLLRENSLPGDGFLSGVCQDWEAASNILKGSSTRLVNARIGVVMSLDGGALQKMVTPFKLGIGGRLGSGTQYISWISIDDVVQALFHLLVHTELEGAVNLVAPNSITNLELTKALGAALNRPTVIPMPEVAVRGIFGQMGEELLLFSTRVEPKKLSDTGFNFQHPSIEDALASLVSERYP